MKGDDGRQDVLLVSVNGRRGAKPPACNQIQPATLSREEVREIYDRGGREREMARAIAAKTSARGRRESATAAQLRKIGEGIKSAILDAAPETKAQLLRNTARIALGNGYGNEASVSLR